MKQIVLLLAASLLLAYVSDSPAAGSSLRTLSQKRSKEERRADRRDRRDQSDAVMLPYGMDSAQLTVVAEYNTGTNAFTKAKASGPFKYCLGVAGTTQCDSSTGWCQGNFKSYGAAAGSDVCLPFPQYGYPACGMRLSGKRGTNPYTSAGIKAGGFTVTIDMVTSEERACVLRRRSSRRLAQDGTGMVTVKPMPLTTSIQPIMTTSEPPTVGEPIKPLVTDTPEAIIALQDPIDTPPKPDEPMNGVPNDGVLVDNKDRPIYTMTGAPGEPIAMESQAPPDFVTTGLPMDDTEFDPNVDDVPLLTDRPNDPQPNWRGDSTNSGTAGSGQILFEGGPCDLHIRLVTLTTAAMQECVCFKGTTFVTMGGKAQRAFTAVVGSKAAFTRWKCKAVQAVECPLYACMI